MSALKAPTTTYVRIVMALLTEKKYTLFLRISTYLDLNLRFFRFTMGNQIAIVTIVGRKNLRFSQKKRSRTCAGRMSARVNVSGEETQKPNISPPDILFCSVSSKT